MGLIYPLKTLDLDSQGKTKAESLYVAFLTAVSSMYLVLKCMDLSSFLSTPYSLV